MLPDERVLVCDRENNRIEVFDLDGRFLDEWTDLARPDDVCADDAGNVYVAELGERAALFPFMPSPWGKDRPARISVLDLQGNVQMSWGEDPADGQLFHLSIAHGERAAPSAAVIRRSDLDASAFSATVPQRIAEEITAKLKSFSAS